MTKQYSLNVVVPCYNPPDGWQNDLIGQFDAFNQRISDWAIPLKLILVNDGSAKLDELSLKALKAKIPDFEWISYPDNRGKGFALRMGIEKFEADLYLITDLDFPYTSESMQRVAETLRDKGGIVAGNRSAKYYKKVPLSRKMLSKILRWILKNGLKQPVDDSQCGLKGFDCQGKKLFLSTKIDRFLFDLEFLMLANAKIAVIPVDVTLREGIVFSKIRLKVLIAEFLNLIKLILRA